LTEATVEPARDRRGPARVAALLFVVAWGTNHFVPLLPLYRQALGLSASALAQLFGIYAVGLVPGLLVGGPLSDRIGRRRLVIPSALIALGGTAILGAGAAGFSRLFLGRFVVGLGSGATFSAATAWLQDLAAAGPTPGAGARRTATALSAGFGGGPLVASLLAQALPHPLVLPYVVQALLLLLALGGVAALPSTRTPRRAAAPRGTEGSFLPRGFVRQVVPIAPWVFGFASISFAVLPGMVRERLGAWAVVFTGVVTAATLLTGLLVQTPLRARSARTAGRFGMVAGVLGLGLGALAAKVASPVAVLIAAPVLGAGYGSCLVAGLRFVEASSAPAQRGRVTGIFYVLAYLGFAAPLLLATVARRHGDAPAVLMAGALALLSLLLRWRDGERSPSS
jgi:hypothetical protein